MPHCYLFPAYLWGIETEPAKRHGVVTARSQPTYEELKRPVIDGIKETIGKFPAYLWGIETQHRRRGCLLPSRFPAYLWGIETYQNRISFFSGKKFPAYLWGIETLNTPYSSPTPPLFPAYLWGIETFYSLWLGYAKRSSQPTYEELKLFPGVLNPLDFAVPSLPMRNWNTLKARSFFFGGKFPAYLWGIETAAGKRAGAD